jgi:hypothetical protein
MKMFPLLFMMVVCHHLAVDAQNLEFTRKNKSKVIEAGTFVKIELAGPYQSLCKTCLLNTMTGKLISVSEDSLQIQLVELNKTLDGSVGYQKEKYVIPSSGPLLRLAKNEILSVESKGKNRVHQYHPGETVSNAISSMASVVLFSNAIAENPSASIGIPIIIAYGVSAALSIAFNQPLYKLKPEAQRRPHRKILWDMQ